MISKFRNCRSIVLASGNFFDAGIIGISHLKGLSGRERYFVDNQRFISAAMRNRPASSSALLRCCPSGILRASAITFVARASQSRLWAEWADVGLGGEPIMMLSKKMLSKKKARAPTRTGTSLTTPRVEPASSLNPRFAGYYCSVWQIKAALPQDLPEP